MTKTLYDTEIEKKGIERGIEIGLERGKIELLYKRFKLSIPEIAEELDISIEHVTEIVKSFN
ncbi:hypothetical protein AN396_00220 [Candidatus Epulonipiscium fishelsonii]|uniref:Uncharacterized protein n=1 Tax=Candidatus Epulonipiscium fishelsonii TaxID=77094 RepID=A0ACC8XHB1_9FIRM|nr:hypothetical protein AN396_00220 [Epulopiscium sp. SCG-B11WGA-EpuloA1]